MFSSHLIVSAPWWLLTPSQWFKGNLYNSLLKMKTDTKLVSQCAVNSHSYKFAVSKPFTLFSEASSSFEVYQFGKECKVLISFFGSCYICYIPH